MNSIICKNKSIESFFNRTYKRLEGKITSEEIYNDLTSKYEKIKEFDEEENNNVYDLGSRLLIIKHPIKEHPQIESSLKDLRPINSFELFEDMLNTKKILGHTELNIINKSIKSNDPIAIIDNIYLDEIELSKVKYLSSKNLLGLLDLENQKISTSSLTFHNIVNSVTIENEKDFKIFLKKKNVSKTIKYLEVHDIDNLTTFNNIYDNIKELDLSDNKNLKTINVKKPNTSLEIINTYNTLIDFSQLTNFPCLREIENFGINNGLLFNPANIIQMDTLVYVKIEQELSHPIDISKISSNLTEIYLHTDHAINDPLKTIKTVTLNSKICPPINCENATSISISAEHVDFKNISNCTLLTFLKVYYINIYKIRLGENHKGESNFNNIFKLKNIEYLTLTHVLMPLNTSFRELTKLKELDLFPYYPYDFDSNLISGLTCLTMIRLTRGTITDRFLKGLPNVTKVYLNYIHTTIDDVLEDVPFLTDLSIVESSANIINKDVISKLPYLKKVNYSAVLVDHIPEDTFSNQSKIEYLNLANNTFRSIENINFNGLVNLRELDITGNAWLTSTKIIASLPLTTLKLSMDINGTFLDLFTFEGLDSLRTLFIDIPFNSASKNFRINIFNKIYKLTSLTINGQVRLIMSVLEPLKSLTYLNLNNVEIVKSCNFKHFRNLENVFINTESDIKNTVVKDLLENNKRLFSFYYNSNLVESKQHSYCNL